MALDALHRQVAPEYTINDGLHLLLHRRDRCRITDDLHAAHGVIDKIVEMARGADTPLIVMGRATTVFRAVDAAGKLVSTTTSSSPCPICRSA